MADSFFKVKNGLTLVPIDPTTVVNPKDGDLVVDSTDSNKLKKYNSTTSAWEEISGSSGPGTPATVFTVANNQSAATNISGLILSNTDGEFVDFSVTRSTASSELVQIGTLSAIKRPNSGTWTSSVTFDGDSSTITFSVLSSGQVQYTTTNMLGTSYVGTISYRVRVGGAVTTTTTSISGTKNYVTLADFENGLTAGYSLGTIGTLVNGLPTATPTFGSGADSNLSTSIVSSGQLSGTKSLSLASTTATVQGNMLATDALPIDISDQAKVLTYSFNYQAVSGAANANFSGSSSNSVAVAVWDVTNSTWIPLAGCFNLVQSSGVGIATGTFQTNSNTASLRLVVYFPNATTGAITMYLDDFSVGPQAIQKGFAGSDEVKFTPVLSSAFAGQSNINFFWKRVGDRAIVSGTFNCTSITANLATISLPFGSLDAAKIGVSNTSSGAGLSVGSFTSNGAASNTGNIVTAVGTSTSLVYFATNSNDSNPLTPKNANAYLTQGLISVKFSVPIAGWSSNTVMSQDTDTRVVSFRGTKSASQSVTAGVTDLSFNVVKDSHAVWTGSTYPVPVSGDYAVSLTSADNGGSSDRFDVYVGGVLYQKLFTAISGNLASGATLLPGLTSGQLISIRCNSTTTISADSFLTIHRLSGPATIAASETVAAKYYASANGTSNLTTPFNADIKVYDSHTAVTTGSGWKFTTPISGKYEFKLYAANSGAVTSAGLKIFKNGSALETFAFIYGTAPYISATTTVELNAGDYIDIRAGATYPWGGDPSRASTSCVIEIKRIGN